MAANTYLAYAVTVIIFNLTQAFSGEVDSLGQSSSKNESLCAQYGKIHRRGADLDYENIFPGLQNVSATDQLCHLSYSVDELNRRLKYDPETRYNVSGLISSKGYPVEDHEVHTRDGFILGLQRIPRGRNEHSDAPRPAILLQHGLLGASSNWVDNLANQSLGFLLADAGFDVWLGNARGSTYSLKHEYLTPDMKEFWYWSWDEMAKYDLPGMINYILNVTGNTQLYYAGHSQGTIMAFSAFSQDKDLGKKVKTFFALGPVTTVEFITSPVRLLADSGAYETIVDKLDDLGHYMFLPHRPIFDLFANTICDNEATVILCQSVLFLFGGYSCEHMNASRIPVYIANMPAGTSIWNLEHWGQMVESGEFVMFDYGCLENLRRYGQIRPPLYHLEEMEVPTALFWGDRDTLATPKDIERMIPKIQNLVYNKRIETYGHLDFIWAIDAAEYVYNELIGLMKRGESY